MRDAAQRVKMRGFVLKTIGNRLLAAVARLRRRCGGRSPRFPQCSRPFPDWCLRTATIPRRFPGCQWRCLDCKSRFPGCRRRSLECRCGWRDCRRRLHGCGWRLIECEWNSTPHPCPLPVRGGEGIGCAWRGKLSLSRARFVSIEREDGFGYQALTEFVENVYAS